MYVFTVGVGVLMFAIGASYFEGCCVEEYGTARTHALRKDKVGQTETPHLYGGLYWHYLPSPGKPPLTTQVTNPNPLERRLYIPTHLPLYTHQWCGVFWITMQNVLSYCIFLIGPLTALVLRCFVDDDAGGGGDDHRRLGIPAGVRDHALLLSRWVTVLYAPHVWPMFGPCWPMLAHVSPNSLPITALYAPSPDPDQPRPSPLSLTPHAAPPLVLTLTLPLQQDYVLHTPHAYSSVAVSRDFHQPSCWTQSLASGRPPVVCGGGCRLRVHPPGGTTCE